MFDDPYFPAITLGSELVAGSFWRDLQGEYWNGLVPARPLYQGVRKFVGDPETSRERVSDWGGPATVWALLCVAERRATRPNGKWGYSIRRLRAPRGGVTRKRHCTYRSSVDFSLSLTHTLSLSRTHTHTHTNLLIVNKLLSLRFSLSLSLSHTQHCKCRGY